MAPRAKKPVKEAIGDIDEQIKALQERKRNLLKKRAEHHGDRRGHGLGFE